METGISPQTRQEIEEALRPAAEPVAGVPSGFCRIKFLRRKTGETWFCLKPAYRYYEVMCDAVSCGFRHISGYCAECTTDMLDGKIKHGGDCTGHVKPLRQLGRRESRRERNRK